MLNEDGWIKFVPPPPSLYNDNDPIPEDTRLKHLFEKYPDSKNIVRLINEGLVYHYTTWETLFKGILSSENLNNKKAVLRAYSVNYMNDVSEGLIIPRGLSDFEERKIAENYYQIIETKEGEKIKVPATMSAFRKNLLSVALTKLNNTISLFLSLKSQTHYLCGIIMGIMGMVYPLDLMQKLLLTKDMIWLSVSMIMNYQIN